MTTTLKRARAAVTLHPKGAISLNRAAAEALDWHPGSGARFLSLAWERPLLVIAPAERGLPLNVYQRGMSYAFLFSAKPFLRDNSLLRPSARRYTPLVHGFSLCVKIRVPDGVPCSRPAATKPRRRSRLLHDDVGDRSSLYPSCFEAASYFHPMVYWKDELGQLAWMLVHEQEFYLDNAIAIQAATELVRTPLAGRSSEEIRRSLMLRGLVPVGATLPLEDPAALLEEVQFAAVEQQILEGSPPTATVVFARLVGHGVPPRIAIAHMAGVFKDCLERGRLDLTTYEIRLSSLLASNALPGGVH